jgi:hypothetical protein
VVICLAAVVLVEVDGRVVLDRLVVSGLVTCELLDLDDDDDKFGRLTEVAVTRSRLSFRMGVGGADVVVVLVVR